MTRSTRAITSHRAVSTPLARTRDSGFPLRLSLPTVVPGQTPGALRFVSLALHILPHKGERHRRYVSARNVSEPYSIRKLVSLKLHRYSCTRPQKSRGTQQAWMNSRNPSNITIAPATVNLECVDAADSFGKVPE